ncbi:hypothetical protein UlMin_038237 [Ulmus minor]
MANFHDRQGKNVLILRSVKQNTASLDNQMRHLVYLLENAILNLREDQEQMAWLIDFIGWTLSTSVPIKSAREAINILQNHYPKRLAVAFLYNPRIFEAFWKTRLSCKNILLRQRLVFQILDTNFWSLFCFLYMLIWLLVVKFTKYVLWKNKTYLGDFPSLMRLNVCLELAGSRA